MRLPVRLRTAAEEDAISCAEFLRRESNELAFKFLDAFDATLALLQEFPGIGGKCRYQTNSPFEMRVWSIAGFKNHLIFYRVLSDEIEVVRVLHAARDLDSIFESSNE